MGNIQDPNSISYSFFFHNANAYYCLKTNQCKECDHHPGVLSSLFVLLCCVDVINIPTLIINTQFSIQTQMSQYLAVKKLLVHSQHTTKHTNINCNHYSFCILFYILSNYFNVFVLLSMATNNGTTCYHHQKPTLTNKSIPETPLKPSNKTHVITYSVYVWNFAQQISSSCSCCKLICV